MTDEENKKKADLFGNSDVKPLFGTEESHPQGKPLFDQDFSYPGDAAFVKPLFDAPVTENASPAMEDFRAFDTYEDSPAEERETAQEEIIQEEIPAEQQFSGELMPEAEIEPAAGPDSLFAEPAAEPENPPFSAKVFAENQPQQPAYTIPKEKICLHGDLEAMSLGTLMAYARETVGYTTEDVYAGTKINERYLLAIEQNQFDKLPTGSFPGAYVRALCSFYHLENSVREIAQQKAVEYCTKATPPDQVYDQLNEHAIINKEEQDKFRRLVMIAGVLLFTLILSTITIITIVSVKKNQKVSVPVKSPVTMEKLEKLDPEPPQVITTELDVPK